MKTIVFLSFLFSCNIMLAQTNYPEINKEITYGNFTQASTMIDEVIEKNNLSSTEKFELDFQKDRLSRIRLDFLKTADDMLK